MRRQAVQKTGKIDRSIKQMIFISALVLLLIWGIFYLYSDRLIREESERTAAQLSGQIVTTLQTDFLELERVSFLLSQSPDVKAFVTERDAAVYHQKSTAVKELIHTLTTSASLVQNLILYSNSSIYYRFSGELSTTAAARVFYELASDTLPTHLSLTLDGQPHIGYASGIYEGEQLLGTVAILTSQQLLKDLFALHSASTSVGIALVADKTVLAANRDTLPGSTIDTVLADAEICITRKVGATPFEVVVFTDSDYAHITRNTFALAVLVTAVLFGVLTIVFLVLQSRHFFRPMLTVMREVEELNLQESAKGLAPTGEPAFDPLVGKINTMLSRLDENAQALREADAQRQRSFIISLKKQINAHFTVNVLNIIKLMAERQEMGKVYEMCDGLSHLLRYAHAADEFIGVMDELFVLQKYMDIMRIRRQDSFDVELDIDDRLEAVVLPRMLIQPLVENAIMHGFQEQQSGGKLTVCALLEPDAVVITIADNGCGIAPEELAALTQRLAAPTAQYHAEGIEHVALLNIARRIASYYGEGYGLWVEPNQPCGTRVTMRVGLQPKQDYTLS